MKKTPGSIEHLARRHLRAVVERAAAEGREPGDYFLVLNRYDASVRHVSSRRAAQEILDLAHSPAQREKLASLLAKPCEPKQLLIVVLAGTQTAEGQLLHIPTIVPEPGAPKNIVVTKKEFTRLNQYLEGCAATAAKMVDQENGRIADYVAIARPPDGAPIVLRREHAREGLRIAGLGDAVKELDVPPASDEEILIVYRYEGTPTWTRMQFTPRARA